MSTTAVKQNKETKKTIKTEKENIQHGIAIALSFLVSSFLLFLLPVYLFNNAITYFVSILFAIIGVGGLGIELNKLSSNPKGLGLDNLGIGLVLGTIWTIFYYYFNLWWINLIILPLMLLGCYGIILGIINIFDNLFSSFSSPEKSKGKFFIKLPVVIAQLAGFILTIMQILQIFKIFK
ncbi:hypothetical protein A8L34_12020 [Bacillus sp. FJAT-27264]|uniref:hypothetical protein n=1 Tax=Paenibacillus sp. (strain DSM 101736 / FJAT-27264) TaxID=1850362 RepID=UPI000807E64C|nr:hypothetical protein [Bacillus sp. FJAT-27264]OBZ14641.1 hypothetical protein A8L34_12020 [Bacillus sp. FJAT-27264]